MSTDKQDRIEELLRKSLLGDQIIDTQFHLSSTRSVSSRRVTHPRALSANNILLSKSSEYFVDLLNSTTSSDPSLIEITDDDQQVPSETCIDDYGYGSDSDLDENDDTLNEAQSCTLSTPSLSSNPNLDDESFEDGSDSAAFNILILKSEKNLKPDDAGSSGTVQGSRHGVVVMEPTPVCLPSLKTRRIFVKDTAFKTFYTLLYYLYTGKVNFFPLKSACTQSQKSLSSALEAPKCSAKSMYRLAKKIGLEALRDKALAFLQNNITEQNVLTEITSSLISRHRPLLEMELDVLYSHIASGPIIAGLPALARRIANNEFPHGADIVIGIHQRLLKQPRPMALHSIPPQEVRVFHCDPKERDVPAREPEKVPSAGGKKKKVNEEKKKGKEKKKKNVKLSR